ncbi:hypothetical protein L195_g064153, partial [Trifolium pratense]
MMVVVRTLARNRGNACEEEKKVLEMMKMQIKEDGEDVT